MNYIRTNLVFLFVLVFMASAAIAVPPKYKKELAEINKVIRNATSTIYNSSKLDGMADELDKSEQMLEALAKKAGVSADSDSDIKRALKRVDDARKKLEKKLAKQGSVPGARTPKSSKWNNRSRSSSFSSQTQKKTESAKDFSEQNKVFNQYKTAVVDLYELNKKMAQARDINEIEEILPRARDIFKVTRKMMSELTKVLPSNRDINDFMRVNEEAKKINLRAKMGGMESYLNKAEGKVNSYVSSLLNEADSEVVSLKHYNRIDLIANSLQKIKKQVTLAESISPDDPKVKSEKTTILNKAEQAYKSALDKFENSRMAQEEYSNSDKDNIKNDMKALYEKKYNDQVVRVVITSSDWEEKAVAEITNDNTISAGYYKYIYGQLAVKKGSGYMVYPMGFRKTWSGKGDDYGALEIRSIGVNYPVLEKNIQK